MDTSQTISSSSFSGSAHPLHDGWKKYVLVIAVTMIVMIAGAVVGAGVTILYFGRMFMQQPAASDQATRIITEKLSDSVNLSPEERVRTEALVEKQMAEVAEIRKKYEKELAKKLGVMSDGISDIIGRERADMCGEWMLRYRGMGGADETEKKEECCCGGGNMQCRMK